MSAFVLEARSNTEGATRQAFDQAFCQLPAGARGDDQTGVLPPTITQVFLGTPVPFATQFWLLRGTNGAVIGRIGANVSATRAHTGYIGFFEVVDGPHAAAAADDLLHGATAWLREQGVADIYGPLNFNTWFTYRLRTDEHPLGYGWEPSNPARYITYFKAFGMQPAALYSTEAVRDLNVVGHAYEGAYARARDQGYTFREVDVATLMEQGLPLVYDLSMRGFTDNFLFEPITLAQFRALYVPVSKGAQGSLFFVEDKDGTPVGFLFGFAQDDFFVFKSIAVLPEHQGRGLSNALMHLLARKAIDMGLVNAIFALVKEGAISGSYARKGELMWRHEYTLFKA